MLVKQDMLYIVQCINNIEAMIVSDYVQPNTARVHWWSMSQAFHISSDSQLESCPCHQKARLGAMLPLTLRHSLLVPSCSPPLLLTATCLSVCRHVATVAFNTVSVREVTAFHFSYSVTGRGVPPALPHAERRKAVSSVDGYNAHLGGLTLTLEGEQATTGTILFYNIQNNVSSPNNSAE